MAKNIIVFSDGTGQAGGIRFDEDRTNIYKLYRATRCGPDSTIDPAEQVTFYDPGLGSPADGGFLFGKFGRALYNLASQATGLGITANIIDCYAAIIRLYRDGDRIFLFGFSRGAYTVRCLAAVIAKCGIPRRMPDGTPLPLDVKGSRKLAATAVKDIYQFCSSQPQTESASYRNFLLDTRQAIALRFRQEHGSSNLADPTKANLSPYFIGVFDTVAALGRTGAVVGLMVGAVVLLAAISALVSLLTQFSDVPYFGWLRFMTIPHVTLALLAAAAISSAAAYLLNYVKYDFHVPHYRFWKSLATLHLAPRKQKFTDYSLDPNVTYAKHAISIDENRYDFARVPWSPSAERAGVRDAEGTIYFEQVWFAGVHADVGGGYQENESRLSDVTLHWMVSQAAIVPNGVKYAPNVLATFPEAIGPQHDECKAGKWQHGVRTLPADPQSHMSDATMHRSVYQRFAAAEVVQYDTAKAYRPENLRNHVDFAHYYDGQRPAPPEPVAVADNVEERCRAKQTNSSNNEVSP